MIQDDTIAAIATPSGAGGIGIVRLSGPDAEHIANTLTGLSLTPRHAHYGQFYDAEHQLIDSGIVLLFKAPQSFTGEDTLELQGHGGVVVVNQVLQRCLQLGARLANPGEFSQRAFLNNKIDLAQAEAIADIITSSTAQAARSAQQSLQGVFSRQIQQLVAQLTELRIYVEAAIDFVDEDIEFIAGGHVEHKINQLADALNEITSRAQQGCLLREGMTIALVGKPNVGKSSLLNTLSGQDSAIVSPIPGTTRDIVKESIQIDGLPVHIMDTAGLRESADIIELEGMRRSQAAMANADRVLWLIDITDPEPEALPEQLAQDQTRVIRIYNKIDLIENPIPDQDLNQTDACYLSLKTGAGLNTLKTLLKQSIGYDDSASDIFIARARHLQALQKAQQALLNANQQRVEEQFELVADELRQAQTALAEITGEVTADDLLGKIFSSFCIGK